VVTVHATVRGMKANLKQSKSEKSSTENYMNFFSKYIEFGEKIGFKRSDKLLPVSKFTLDEIINLYKIDITNKSVVTQNATDIEMFKPDKSNNPGESVITFIGRFYAIKGFDTYLKAMIDINKKGYKIKPYLVGRGNKKEVNNILKNNFSNFTLEGLTPYNSMPRVYGHSDILIVPSLYENCPAVVLEAMSSGKLVIASNVGGIPEIIKNGENGLLFEKGNAVDLENKIISILEGTYDVNKIRINARNTILKYYGWKERGKEITDLYRDIIK